MPDYIPVSDQDYDQWLTNFVTYARDHQAELGLSDTDLAPLLASYPDWQTRWSELQAAQVTVETARQSKTDQRQITEDQARTLATIIQANPAVTDSQRVALQITVKSTTRSPSPVPTTRPLPRLEQTGRLQHTIHFVDETTPTRKAKPNGVRGCQIWVFIGDTAPLNPEAFQYLGTDTRTPYVNSFEPEEGGQLAHYYLRWVNTRDEPGPWSTPIQGLIVI